MRVLHVAEVAHGGVISLVRTFAEQQLKAGFDVHVLAAPDVGPLAGVVHEWSPRRRRLTSYPSYALRLREVVTAVRPDVVHLHSFFPGLFGRMLRLPRGTAVVYQPHSWAFERIPARAVGAVVAWEKFAARRTDVVVTNCESELAEGHDHGLRVKGEVVGLPIDTEHFAPVDSAERLRIRQDLGLDDRRLLVCVGRISHQKGQVALATAWESDPIPDAVLAMIGPGDPTEVAAAAPTAVGSTLRLVGALSDVRPWLHAADVCVQPSRYEGQSVAMAEAMSCGRAVVMTDVNGAREALRPDGEPAAGAVVPLGDLDSLLREARARLDDESLAREEEHVARGRAVSMFGLDEVMGRLEQVYRRATAEPAPPYPV
jgi:glycosyltransferase involved in cell wall biosynthesis